MIDHAVFAAKKRSYRLSQAPDKEFPGPGPEPSVHVLGQKRRGFILHPGVILDRDIQPLGDLGMARLGNGQGIYPAINLEFGLVFRQDHSQLG